MLHVTY